MKKAKWLLTSLLCIVMMLTMAIGLAACGNPDDSDKDKPTETVKITDGVFSCASDPSHVQLVKFKEDGTFYAQSVMQNEAFFGKWELVDMDMEYITVDTTKGFIEQATPDKSIHKATKAVKFMHNDGSAYNVRGDYSYTGELEENMGQLIAIETNKDVAKNYIAYADNRLHATTFDGGQYVRTLVHNPDSTFSEENEVKNELYHFMVKDLPAWAEDDYIVQDLELTIYHNSFVDLATSENQISGKLTQNGNVFTFDNGATVTVSADGKTATYTKGEITIELVEWANAAEKVASATGTTEGIGELKLELYNDGSALLLGAGKEFAGTYTVEDITVKVNIAATGFTIKDFTIDGDNFTGKVQINTMQVEVDMTGKITGTLFGSVKTLASIDTEWATMKFTFALNSNNTGSIVMGETVVTTFHWAFNADNSFTFRKVSKGTVAFELKFDGAAPAAEFKWTGKLKDDIDEITLTFNSDAASLGVLKTGAATQKFTVAGTDIPNSGMTIKSNIYFYSDGTGVIDVNIPEINMAMNDAFTFHWNMNTTTQQIEFTETSITFAMAPDYSSASFTATVALGQLGNVDIVFTVAPTALGALK